MGVYGSEGREAVSAEREGVRGKGCLSAIV